MDEILASLRTELSGLDERLRNAEVALAKLEEIPQAMKDHAKRLDEFDQFRWKAVALVSAMGFVGSMLGSLLAVLLRG